MLGPARPSYFSLVIHSDSLLSRLLGAELNSRYIDHQDIIRRKFQKFLASFPSGKHERCFTSRAFFLSSISSIISLCSSV